MRHTTPRPRRRRATRCHQTPGKFWISGYPVGCDNLYPVRRMVIFDNWALSGDTEIITAANECAAALREDLSQPLPALSVLLALFLAGVELGGDIPTSH